MSLIPAKNTATSVTDDVGQTFVYNAVLNQWLQVGADFDQSIVGPSNKGLVTPGIIKLLELVDQANHINQFIGIKPLRNPEAYWYYLYNPDNYLRIDVENSHDIRIEIGYNALLRRIRSRSTCIGPVGKKGPTGAAGIRGLSGPPEFVHSPPIADNILTVSAVVPIPLDTAISVRTYTNSDPIAEVKISLVDGRLTFIYPSPTTLKLDEVQTKLSYINGTVTGTMILANGVWPRGTILKARQCGPRGFTGPNGTSFIGVLDTSVSDPSVRATSALKVVRKGQSYDIHSISSAVGTHLPVLHLRTSQDTSFVTTPTSLRLAGEESTDRWVSVEPSITSAKGLMRWSLSGIDPKVITNTTLDLPSWTPLRVIGYSKWSGFKQADEIQNCQEDLFICLSDLQPPFGNDPGNCAQTVPTICVPTKLCSFVTQAHLVNKVVVVDTHNLAACFNTHIGPCDHRKWRLIEVGHCVTYASGDVSHDGQLLCVGPFARFDCNTKIFTSPYTYQGFLELQIGIKDPNTNIITWPGTCT